MKKKIRLHAVMTTSESFGWHHRPRIVSAFTTRGQARDEVRELRDDGERWWVESGTFTPDTKTRKKADR